MQFNKISKMVGEALDVPKFKQPIDKSIKGRFKSEVQS